MVLQVLSVQREQPVKSALWVLLGLRVRLAQQGLQALSVKSVPSALQVPQAQQGQPALQALLRP